MINVSYKKLGRPVCPVPPHRFPSSPIAASPVLKSSLCFLVFSGCPASSPPHRTSAQSMASPMAAAPAEFTQMEAARQSLIAISQSVPEIGRAPVIRPPHGGGVDDVMDENGHDDVAEQRNRAKLISISNQSPDARPTPCPPKNGAA